MKFKTVTLILLIFPTLLYSQHKFLPIIDSTTACSYNNAVTGYDNMPNPFYKRKFKSGGMEIFYIVEKMPKPIVPVSDIEFMLEKSIRLRDYELTYQGNIFLQCLVNCKGQAGDYQIYNCPAELVNIGRHILNEFGKRIINWSPPVNKGYNVDLLAKIKVTVNKGKYEIVAPFY